VSLPFLLRGKKLRKIRGGESPFNVRGGGGRGKNGELPSLYHSERRGMGGRELKTKKKGKESSSNSRKKGKKGAGSGHSYLLMSL